MTNVMATMMTAAMVMDDELRIEADSRYDDHAERYAATGRDLSAFDDMVAEAEAETAAMRDVYRAAGRRWIAAELELGYKRTPADFRRAVAEFADQALGCTPDAPTLSRRLTAARWVSTADQVADIREECVADVTLSRL